MKSLLFVSNSFLNLSHEKISGQIHLLVSMLVTGWMFQTINMYPRPEGLLIFYCEAVTPSAHLQLHVTRGGAVIYTHVCGFCSVLPQSKLTLRARRIAAMRDRLIWFPWKNTITFLYHPLNFALGLSLLCISC